MNAHPSQSQFGQAAPLPLPQNVEAEQALLGAVLWENQILPLVTGFLRPEHFFEELHRRIYAVAIDLFAAGQVATHITLKQHLGGDVDLGGGMSLDRYLARLKSEATTTVNAVSYARAVHDTAIQRDLIAYADDLQRSVREAPASVTITDQLSSAESRLLAIRGGLQTGRSMSISVGKVGDRLVQAATEIRDGKQMPIPSSGFSDLDRAIGGGFRPGRLVVIGGRPGSGKTVLGVASARRIARQGFGVAFFSLEIDEDEMTARTIASELSAGFHTMAYRDILSGHLSDPDFERLKEGRDRIANLPLEIVPQGGTTIAEIAAKSRLIANKYERAGKKLAVVFIDYLGLITPSDRYRSNPVEELGESVKKAKDLAKDLGVTVVLFSQLNRGVEGRDDKRPMMSDLRGSGNIEEHADVVGLLYRPSYYDQPGEEDKPEIIEAMHRRRHDLEIGLGKNRLGPVTRVTLYCDVASSCVDNMRSY